jgi:hypothetical protein
LRLKTKRSILFSRRFDWRRMKQNTAA